jgi:hypothetical protein
MERRSIDRRRWRWRRWRRWGCWKIRRGRSTSGAVAKIRCVFSFDPDDEPDEGHIAEVRRRVELNEFTPAEGDDAVRRRAKERLYPGGIAWWSSNGIPWR